MLLSPKTNWCRVFCARRISDGQGPLGVPAGPTPRRVAGNNHVKEILQRLFQYIGLLQGPGGVTQALYDDNAVLCRLRFDFRDHPAAFNYTSSLANLMHDYPADALLLVQQHVPLRFDEAVTRSMLDALAPADCSVMWASHVHTSDGMDTEPWCVLCVHCVHPRKPPVDQNRIWTASRLLVSWMQTTRTVSGQILFAVLNSVLGSTGYGLRVACMLVRSWCGVTRVVAAGCSEPL